MNAQLSVSTHTPNVPSGRPHQDAPSILDWPLPQPAYDEVAAELEDQSEDQEVRSIYRALTETEEVVSASCRNESQSADLFQELQREVAPPTCLWCGLMSDFSTRLFNVSPVKGCLNCPITVLGDGEAAGSYGNRPLPPLLSPPPGSGSSGTTSPDLPASCVSLLHLCLLYHLLFGGEAGVAPSKPRPPTAPFQK